MVKQRKKIIVVLSVILTGVLIYFALSVPAVETSRISESRKVSEPEKSAGTQEAIPSQSESSPPKEAPKSNAPEWKLGIQYNTGMVVSYKGKEYRCIQPHSSQNDWDPSAAPSLWQDVGQTNTDTTAEGSSGGEANQNNTGQGNQSKEAQKIEDKSWAKESQGVESGDQAAVPSDNNTPLIKPKHNIVGYYTEWSIYGAHNGYEVSNIPWNKITHVNYAFAKITNGKVGLYDSWAAVEKPFGDDKWDTPLKGNLGQLIKYKQRYPNVKTLISVGGWTLSGEFHGLASKEETRKAFSDSCVEFIRKYGFDGVDIDWEYPGNPGNNNPYGPEDKHNFTLLLKTLRSVLDDAGKKDGKRKRYLLTIAAPAGYDKIDDTEPNLYHEYLDFINLMTYDIHGAWENKTNHHAPLYKNPNDPSEGEMKEKYNTDWAVKEYLRLGVPAEKLNVGVPYYSRGWKDVDPNAGANGMFANANGAPMGVWDDFNSGATGTNPFYHIKGTFLKDSSYKVYRDEYSKVPWLYNASLKQVFTYEDEISLSNKCDYIKDKKLGGVMFWEFSGDYPVKGSILTDLLYSKLKDK
ncbi:MAG: glycosyl hydrolase family 18 protein [Clostridia bacterium]|nr:glycosyl hydrolase family 18 protein [Clostridia bacterium]